MRYTQKDAERSMNNLARKLNISTKPYSTVNGRTIANVGAWVLNYAPVYGGVIIEEIDNEQGGIFHPVNTRRMKPNEFVIMIDGIINLLNRIKQ